MSKTIFRIKRQAFFGIIATVLCTILIFVVCGGDPVSPTPLALTGTVNISGTVEVGQILTANTDSLGGNGTISYQWIRDRSTLIGDNNSTYTIEADDIGYTITVIVTRTGNSGSVISIPTSIVPNMYTLAINIDPIIGGTVTPMNEASYLANTPVIITARAEDAYEFVRWTVTSGTARFTNANSSNTTITLGSDATILANFRQVGSISGATLFDSRDGKSYRTVVIGTQTWMAENLNINANGSVCYANNLSNCDTYGTLYDWAMVMNFDASCNSTNCNNQVQTKHQGICPAGWHVPSDEEWTTLVNHAGGTLIAGEKLKSTSGWNIHDNYYTVTTNDFNFSALPGGGGGGSNVFLGIGDWGTWWSATGDATSDMSRASRWWMYSINSSAGRENDGAKVAMHSLRCVKN